MTQFPSQQVPPPGPPSSGKVAGPAIALIVVGAVGSAYHLLNLINALRSPGQLAAQWRQAGAPQQMIDMAGKIGAVSVVLFLVFLALNVITLFGGIKMRKCESYGLAMTAAIVQLIPCLSACCLIGIPFGIWALVVLLNPEVKAAFRK